MSLRSKILVTFGFLLFLVLLGTADAIITRGKIVLPSAEEEGVVVAGTTTTTDGSGITKSSGPKIDEVLPTLGLASTQSDSVSIIRRVIPAELPVETRVILKDGDRVGLIAFAETPLVKNYFLALKEALHSSFTPGMTDLIDETQKREGKPIRNFLTFLDPGISEERLVFIRVRERLYEFHLAEKKEDTMFELIEGLTD